MEGVMLFLSVPRGVSLLSGRLKEGGGVISGYVPPREDRQAAFPVRLGVEGGEPRRWSPGNGTRCHGYL